MIRIAIRRLVRLALASLFAAAARGHASGQEAFTSGADQRESVMITVYNQNFGLVRETRRLDLASGRSFLEFADVASTIQPETVHITSLSGRPLAVLEQNYRYDLLSPQKLLEKYVGREVTVYRSNPVTGEELPVRATVLSVNQGPVLRIGDEITFNYPGRFSFPEVPDNLISKPTLVWMLDGREERPRVEVSYLAGSLNWRADYVLVMNEDDSEGSLVGWVTLDNQSGASYENATLKLVAGDVQRVSGNQPREQLYRGAAMAADALEQEAFLEESFFEYHLYTLSRPATVLNNEKKQVTLLEADGFDVTKRFIYYGASQYYRSQWGQPFQNQKVGVYLDFENDEENGLGMPLPKGVVRVYKRDGSGAQQFVGEDLIDHTPRDERVRIKMGEAFDVIGDRRQTEYDVISSCVTESAWEIELRNHKDEDITVQVVEPVGGDWTLLESSHRPDRIDAFTFSFDAVVPARGETTVSYRVRVRWC